MSDDRNDYQSLYEDEPEAAVSEGKEATTIYATTGVVPTICGSSFILDTAQPQPAGTETISKEIRSVSEFTGLTEDQTLRFVGCLLRVGLEIFPSAKLAALQRSHDELLRLAEMAKSSSSMGLRDLAETALANAEEIEGS